MVIKLRFCSNFEQRVFFLHLDFEVEVQARFEEIFYVGNKFSTLATLVTDWLNDSVKVFLKLLISVVHGPLTE